MRKGKCRMLTAGLIGLCALVWTTLAMGQDIKVNEEINRHIQAEYYQATIANDGCLTSLKVMGEEFLMAGPNGSRGSYFFSNGMLTVPNVSSPEQG